jgi:small subunit ribosomal protein S6
MVAKEVSEQKLETEDGLLRDYELVLIISPEVVDEALETRIDNISQFINERGGTVSSVERWGKRQLAYPIEHFMEGVYVLFKLKFKPALCQELESSLQISEEIIRHLLIKES